MSESPTGASSGPAPFDWMAPALQSLEQSHLRRRRREIIPRPGCRAVVDGRDVVNFASNDYLDLAGDPRVVAAAQRALTSSGVGARASALVCGRTPWHVALERRIARFERQTDALLFPTGFAANLGTVGALVGKGDVVFSDRLNHASLIDGCRLSGAQIQIYDHHNLGELARALRDTPTTGRRLIVTDSVFSMDGDLAPLPRLCDLAEQHAAMLLVDEAHATGVFGAHGRGVSEHQGVEERELIRIGTLSKAVGTLGGFVAGPALLIDWLWNRARPQVFSTALPPAICAAAEQALEIIETEPARRRQLFERSEMFRAELRRAGISTVTNAEGPIVPVLLEHPQRAVQVAERLEQAGFFVGAIRPPTVPPGTSRLRITLSSGHDWRDIEQLLASLSSSLEAC
ncbi:MAG: 8-amino-7-oxononanoate synthase [Planctomycetes bacterium]|nr:8-amino-7-oxononanoate synthase [Planctomycetota bacterium]